MTDIDKCQCKTIQHNHTGGQCNNSATEADNLCKDCHDKAQEEFAKVEVPTYIPSRKQLNCQVYKVMGDIETGIDKSLLEQLFNWVNSYFADRLWV